MTKFHLENNDNNEWLNKANELIDKYSNIDKSMYKDIKLSLHHILIRSIYPQYTNDERNHLWMTWQDHWLIHYYMWKADTKYCAAFWFCYVYFKKHFNMTITDEECAQLKSDMSAYRKNKRKVKYDT